jgi:hypothetical protein
MNTEDTKESKRMHIVEFSVNSGIDIDGFSVNYRINIGEFCVIKVMDTDE